MSEANWCVGWRSLISGGHTWIKSDKFADRVMDTILSGRGRFGEFVVRERLYACQSCHEQRWLEVYRRFRHVVLETL